MCAEHSIHVTDSTSNPTPEPFDPPLNTREQIYHAIAAIMVTALEPFAKADAPESIDSASLQSARIAWALYEKTFVSRAAQRTDAGREGGGE